MGYTLTQVQKITNYIQEHGSISTMEAFQMGITRRASRSHALRRSGLDIESEPVSGKNRDGETVHYSRYKLA